MFTRYLQPDERRLSLSDQSCVDMNVTNTTRAPGDLSEKEMQTEKMLTVFFLVILTFLTTLLNSGVIIAICTDRKLRLPANFLICSLAVTDCLVGTLVMPLSIIYIATETWGLGWIICQAWLSVDMTCCTCSILHLCVIALDRYWAITDAIEYVCKRTARRAGLMVASVWAISVLISTPSLFWRQNYGAGDHTRCIIQHDHAGYTIYSTFGAFYIPMVLILILYYRIYHAAKTLYKKRGSTHHLSGRSTNSQHSFSNGRSSQPYCISEPPVPGPVLEFDNVTVSVQARPFKVQEESDGERNQICSSRERRAARVLGLVLGAFILCWLPFFVKELLVGLHVVRPASPGVSDLLTWLGYLNSLINPLLYTSFNDDFKQAFKKLLRYKDHG